MGMHVIAEGFWLADPANWLVILQVALGLGFVIFVHELGHFAVAKMCGVKCEKFYLGFDIYGLKLFKKQWGETEYGIGVLPLGGYVKMLGQDDNPTKNAAEMERSRSSGQTQEHHGVGGGDLPAEPTAETPPVHDPRSYLAQSVPERMAIISAGVIMNLIFAVIMAAIAYGMGVPEPPAKITEVVAGEPAWKAGLRPGDDIVQIEDIENPRYRDLFASVALADLEKGVQFTVKRPERSEPFTVTIYPERLDGRLKPTIGVPPPESTILATEVPEFRWLPAGKTEMFHDGDEIIKVNGVAISSFAELQVALVNSSAKPVTLTVRRGDSAGGEEVEVRVPAHPIRHLGLVMTMGEITAIQTDSPAAMAGLKPGDKITKFDDDAPADPFLLPFWLHDQAGRELELTVQRGGEELKIQVTPRKADWYEMARMDGKMAAPALGIAYTIGNTIESIETDGPANSHSVLAPGIAIVEAQFTHADETYADLISKPLKFDQPNWALLMSRLQFMPAGTQVVLTTDSDKSVTVTPAESDQWFSPERGLITQIEKEIRTAESFGEAISLGARETVESAFQVFQFLGALVSGQLSPKNLGGPGTIAVAAAGHADMGVASLLMFLTMLSANLAVINFLPIPILDGGHMVFLTLEGIRGKPVSERVVVALTYVGFAMVLALMIFVIGLDVERFWPS